MGVWLEGGGHHSGRVRSLDRCMIGFVFFFVSSLVAGDWLLFLMLNLVRSLLTCGALDLQDLESSDLSPDFVRDDGILVSTDFKPLSIQLGSGSVLYHQP